MQDKTCGYLGEVVAIYKKNGVSKGARHGSIEAVEPGQLSTLTYLALRVFIPMESSKSIRSKVDCY